eukprot:1187638-Prorocentrum_minimum.AAC.1
MLVLGINRDFRVGSALAKGEGPYSCLTYVGPHNVEPHSLRPVVLAVELPDIPRSPLLNLLLLADREPSGQQRARAQLRQVRHLAPGGGPVQVACSKG